MHEIHVSGHDLSLLEPAWENMTPDQIHQSMSRQTLDSLTELSYSMESDGHQSVSNFLRTVGSLASRGKIRHAHMLDLLLGKDNRIPGLYAVSFAVENESPRAIRAYTAGIQALLDKNVLDAADATKILSALTTVQASQRTRSLPFGPERTAMIELLTMLRRGGGKSYREPPASRFMPIKRPVV